MQKQSSTKRARVSRRTDVPDDWSCFDQVSYAEEIGLDLDEDELFLAGEKFLANAQSKGRQYADWDAGFRMWLLRMRDFRAGACSFCGGRS